MLAIAPSRSRTFENLMEKASPAVIEYEKLRS
jgi:hypothetical protein